MSSYTLIRYKNNAISMLGFLIFVALFIIFNIVDLALFVWPKPVEPTAALLWPMQSDRYLASWIARWLPIIALAMMRGKSLFSIPGAILYVIVTILAEILGWFVVYHFVFTR